LQALSVVFVVIRFSVHKDSGKSWNLKFKFSRPGKSSSQAYRHYIVLESPWKTLVKGPGKLFPATCDLVLVAVSRKR